MWQLSGEDVVQDKTRALPCPTMQRKADRQNARLNSPAIGMTEMGRKQTGSFWVRYEDSRRSACSGPRA